MRTIATLSEMQNAVIQSVAVNNQLNYYSQIHKTRL